MKIDCYEFLFHPCAPNHSIHIQVLSIITNIALTALTGGIYLVIFGGVHWKERHWVPHPTHQGFIGTQPLKIQQKTHLNQLRELANRGQWEHLQAHTHHPASGFDWWMFPTDRASHGYGNVYRVGFTEIRQLKQDQEFMNNYREGVILVAKSWGWDLEEVSSKQPLHPQQKWTGYQVRLGKMLHSLQLFGQDDLRAKLSQCLVRDGVQKDLEPWIQDMILSDGRHHRRTRHPQVRRTNGRLPPLYILQQNLSSRAPLQKS